MNAGRSLAWSIAAALVVSTPAAAQKRNVPWYERGEFLHFAASAELATNGYTLAAAFSDDVRVRLVSGAALGITAGFAKELYDLADHNDFSWKDISWGVVGTVTGLLISWLVDKYLFAPRRTASPQKSASAAPRPFDISISPLATQLPAGTAPMPALVRLAQMSPPQR